LKGGKKNKGKPTALHGLRGGGKKKGRKKKKKLGEGGGIYGGGFETQYHQKKKEKVRKRESEETSGPFLRMKKGEGGAPSCPLLVFSLIKPYSRGKGKGKRGKGGRRGPTGAARRSPLALTKEGKKNSPGAGAPPRPTFWNTKRRKSTPMLRAILFGSPRVGREKRQLRRVKKGREF